MGGRAPGAPPPRSANGRCSSTWLTPVKFRLIACAQEGVLCSISSLVLFWQITALQILKRKFVDIFQEVMEIKMFSFDIFLTTVYVRTSEPLPSFSPSRNGAFLRWLCCSSRRPTVLLVMSLVVKHLSASPHYAERPRF